MLCELLPFIFVTPSLPSYHFPPSLTVPCQSACCRFLIKESFPLMSSSISKPPLTLSSPLTPSSSVGSFISPPLPCEAAWLTSISLSLESANWASVCTGRAQSKCFTILLYFFSLFIPSRRLAHWLKKKKRSRLYFLLSPALVLFCKISTKILSQLLPVFVIKLRTIHLVNPALCLWCPLNSEMQLTSAPLQHFKKE